MSEILSYGELLVGAPAPDLAADTVAVEQLEPILNGTIWLSWIADGQDVHDPLTSLPAGTTIRLESTIDPLSFGSFLLGNITGEATYLTAPVVGTDGNVLIEGDPHTVTLTAPVVPPTPGSAYATPEELARILQLPNPTPAQTAAMNRVLQAASTEIDNYLDLTEPEPAPPPALVVAVNLERAVEHWKQEQSPFGIVVLGGESTPMYPSRNSWRRHAQALLPLKEGNWGVG